MRFLNIYFAVSYIQLKCDEPVSGKFVTIKRVGGMRKDMLLLCEVVVNVERGTGLCHFFG